jgi:hypothetical protein
MLSLPHHLLLAALAVGVGADAETRFAASSSAAGSSAEGASDGDRFDGSPARSWHGRPGEKQWWWEARFARPRPVWAILQIQGDDAVVFRNAPRDYVWQVTSDGKSWEDLAETRITDERRMFRLHRLARPRTVLGLRLRVQAAAGTHPTLREVVFFADPKASVPFPPWAVVVSTTGERKVPGEGLSFVPLARACKGWEGLQAQNVWLRDFNERLLAAEPRPLCAFLSGNFIDWCQQKREHWRGTQEVLRKGRLPIWASCGGAQGLAILADTGVDSPWDCPHCRDPKRPKSPIYGHIGHTGKRPCGDYSACTFERGACNILLAADDPAFAGLPREFRSMESHCGQIEYVPKGWVLVAQGGKGALTKTQCLRVKDRPVYAAQFHIEMKGTPESSARIMSNFLSLARAWGGYNPDAAPVAEPRPFGKRP